MIFPVTDHPSLRGGAVMGKDKSKGKQQFEKERLHVQDQKTENVFEDQSRVPNEQNAFKETQPKYGE
ncbi:virulence factor mce family protein [Sporosarcina newyorkensis 2681]|uniref:Uncharacterized protein n=3 Tax=Caryophanaceae TaxID=186818 RepID=A0A1T4YHE6_9BACL|nr:virulence factor mce family protein [Sporosarcina newyorkensis 2681]SKB01123.1 hypothetical protein SAMN04244570_2599 [Sporosarcina newyorkensis]